MAVKGEDAERAVLASVLRDSDALNQVAPFLRPEHFAGERNRVIYAAMLVLRERGELIDFLTLSDELQRQELYEAAGNLASLASLLTTWHFTGSPAHYGRMVERGAATRRPAAGDTNRQLEALRDSANHNAAVGEERVPDSLSQAVVRVLQ